MPESRGIKFCKSNYQKLLEFEPMRDLALDRIDEAVIERFKFWALRKVGRTTVNRVSRDVEEWPAIRLAEIEDHR